MPGIATHHVFGTELYPVIEHTTSESADDRSAFLLGNQGPDPLFYLAATPAKRPLRRIGSTMHRQHTVKLLQAIHNRMIANGESTSLVAYALGFLCHFILDATVHPLVYAQEHAICRIGIEQLAGEWPHRVAHATIETAIDEYVLTTKLKTSADRTPPHKTMLKCPDQILFGISRAMADVITRVYGINCPDSAFMAAVGLYRASQTALDSQSSGLRRHLDYLPKTGAAMAYVRALSLRPKPLPRTPFTNDDHIAWPHAFIEGKIVSESFDELYDLSVSKAQNAAVEFAQYEVNADILESIVEGVNFLGQPANS